MKKIKQEDLDKFFEIFDEGCKVAEEAANKALEPYSQKINDYMKTFLPEGHSIVSGNALAIELDKDGNQVSEGRGYQPRTDIFDDTDNPLLSAYAFLQYALDYETCRINFDVPNELKK